MSNFDLLAAKIAAEPPEEIARVLRAQFDRVAELEQAGRALVHDMRMFVLFRPEPEPDPLYRAMRRLEAILTAEKLLGEEPK